MAVATDNQQQSIEKATRDPSPGAFLHADRGAPLCTDREGGFLERQGSGLVGLGAPWHLASW